MTDKAQRVFALARPPTYAKERLGLSLHPTQAAVLNELFPTQDKPQSSRVSFRCANEVGKTSHVAVAAILYALEIRKAQAISTAGVWMQVASQLVPALKRHAYLYPDWQFNETSIKISGVDRYIGFSTRDEGFAQGFHRHAGMPLLAIIDEAAAVADPIYAGVEDRCNPDWLLIMGSPLDPAGMFYRIETSLSKFYQHFHLSQLHCLTRDGYWLEAESIERKIAKWGNEHPLVKSNVYGEFPDQTEDGLISLGEFEACLQSPPKYHNDPIERHGFLDFAAGRAKNVFAVRVGNKVWIEKKWTDRNTMSACGEFLATYRKLHREHGLLPEECEGDADGLGLPMVHRLREMGFALSEFHGGQKARFEENYANAVSEAWGEGVGKMKRKLLIVPDDLDFRGQVLSRKIKRNSSGKMQLESKEDLAKRGLESPDEADAVFGAAMPTLIRQAKQVMGTDPMEQFHPKSDLWEQDWRQHEEEVALPGTWVG